jgi:Flp pilus assembly pilin Flp
MLRLLKSALADDRAATMVEYALIISLLAVAVLVGINSAGGALKSSFNAIGSAVGNA